MFKLKYNALSLVQVFFGFLNSILLLKVFGVSGQTDAYFIGDAILGGAVMLQMMAVEQFMYFYHEQKAGGRENAGALYSYALYITLVLSLAALLLLNVFSGTAIKLFAYRLDPSRVAVLKRLFPVFSLLAVFNPVNSLNTRLLNAEGRFAYPYLLGIIPSLFSTCAMLLMWFLGNSDIVWLLAASVGGGAVAALLSLAAVKACGAPLRLAVSHPAGRELVFNSVKIKFGHNINGMLAPLITNNILSASSQGAVSYFAYAWKIVTAIGNLATGPSARMFASAVSSAWPRGNPGRIKALVREFLRLITPLFSLSALASYAVLPYALALVLSARLAAADIAAIRLMFLALAAWYLAGLVESAFLQVCVAARRSRVFILNNTVFIAVYFSAAWTTRGAYGIYSIPLGLVSAQSVSLLLYYRAAAGALGRMEKARKMEAA